MINNIQFNSTIYSKSSILCNVQNFIILVKKRSRRPALLCGSSENHLFYLWTLKIIYFNPLPLGGLNEGNIHPCRRKKVLIGKDTIIRMTHTKSMRKGILEQLGAKSWSDCVFWGFLVLGGKNKKTEWQEPFFCEKTWFCTHFSQTRLYQSDEKAREILNQICLAIEIVEN